MLILHLPLRITDLRHPSRRELFLCAAPTATKHRSYTYQLWDAEANEWEVWHSLKRFGGVGGAPAKVTAPPATPDPIPFPMEETVRGISDGVMRTLEGNVQSTLRDILPAAVREAMKTESSTRATREMQKLQNELAVAKSQAKAAEKRAQDLQDALEDRQKIEVEGELKHMREKWEEEKERSSKYLTILEKQK